MRSILRYLRHGPLKRYHSIWTRLGKTYQRFIKTCPFTPSAKQKIGSYGPFRFHPCFAFSAFHQWGNDHNAGFAQCIESCRDKQCVIDVGAHIGLVSMPISKVLGPRGVVYAFEPATANRQYLEYHIKKNELRNIEVLPYLVGNSNQDNIPFYEMDADTGMNSVLPMKHQGDFKPTQKQQITLDSFCQQKEIMPDVLKIDVEGYELEVLQGAKTILSKHPTQIYLSVHPSHLEKLGHSTSDLTQFIESIDYQITELDGSPVNEFQLNEYLVKPKHHFANHRTTL